MISIARNVNLYIDSVTSTTLIIFSISQHTNDREQIGVNQDNLIRIFNTNVDTLKEPYIEFSREFKFSKNYGYVIKPKNNQNYYIFHKFMDYKNMIDNNNHVIGTQIMNNYDPHYIMVNNIYELIAYLSPNIIHNILYSQQFIKNYVNVTIRNIIFNLEDKNAELLDIIFRSILVSENDEFENPFLDKENNVVFTKSLALSLQHIILNNDKNMDLNERTQYILKYAYTIITILKLGNFDIYVIGENINIIYKNGISERKKFILIQLPSEEITMNNYLKFNLMIKLSPVNQIDHIFNKSEIIRKNVRQIDLSEFIDMTSDK